jgi:anti-sigma B factor antagonist
MGPDRTPQRRVVSATGELDMASAPRLRDALFDAVADHDGDVVVDLAGVTFMDSTGLGVLATAYKRLGREGRRLVIKSPTRNVRRVLEVCRLDEVLAIED